MKRTLNRRQWFKISAAGTAALWVSSQLPACRKEKPLLSVTMDNEFIRLDNNENPYGIATKARAAIIEAIRGSHRYPHRFYPDLIKMIAEKEGLAAENILLGAGSTEIMNMAIFAYGVRGEVLTHEPTYFDFIFYAEQAGCSLRRIPVNENLRVNLEAMANHLIPPISLVYICNPNNPTGAIIPAKNLRDFCEEASERTLVLVDEAYHEYVDDVAYSSMVNLVSKGKKVLITRTFSKIYGLAGLRVGYGIAHPEIIANLKKVQMNFASIAYPGLRAAIAAYSDEAFTRLVKEKTRSVKSYLEKELASRGYYHVPSQANFVLFQVNRNSKEMAAELEKRQVLVRPFTFAGKNWIRVSVGTREEIQTFLSVLDNLER